MAFRDEHEAALQRAAALEREREQAEREKERAERELARARLERDNLADELAETKRKLAEARGEPILSPGDRGAKAAERGRAAALGFVAIMAIAVIGPAVCHSSRSATPPPPTTEPVSLPPLPALSQGGCVLMTDPLGAEVVLDGESAPMGYTPFVVLPSLWRKAGGLELRLPGYQSARLEPLGMTACNRTIVLQPASSP